MTAAKPNRGALLAAALDYAARGWAVLPCSPKNKRPLVAPDKDPAGKPIKGTGGLRKASTDPDQLRAWWKKWPDAMVGVAMGGNGLFVLDFDPRIDGDTGEEWTLDRLKAALEAQIGCDLPVSLAVRTPSGGVHVYLNQPREGEAIRNRGNLPEHVDVRGEGGYVIAPPSVMHDGRRYRWLRNEAGASIADAPASLIAILQARKGAKPSGQPQLRVAGGTDSIERYALAALDKECGSIRSAAAGKRQDALNRGAFCVAQLVAAGALPETRARSAVVAAAFANPGNDDQRAIEATIDSGWAAGIALPRDLSKVAERSTAGHSRRLAAATANDNRPSPPLQGAEVDALHARLAVLPMTDLGNAERFAARYGALFRYVDRIGWIAYDGRRFVVDGAEALIGGWVHDTVRAIRHEARVMRESGRRDRGDDGALDDLVDQKRDGTEVLLSDKLAAWARASESANRLGCIAGIAKNLTSAGLTIQPENLDSNPFLINVLNGTLELVHESDAPEPWAALRLRPHDPADLITRLAPVQYQPAAACPIYDRFLERVQPAEEMRSFLHRWGGLSLTGDVSAQKLVFHHGKGANGKSTLVDTWATIAGDYAGTVPIETFLDQGRKRKGSDASPDLAALVGVRMLRTSEPEKGAKLAEALIKLATGGEPISVRRLNRDPFDLHPAFKVMISGNYRPTITGVDDGIWRRVLLVPWDVQIPDAEKDLRLVEKMRGEASGILNRMLAGLIDWRLHGLQEPASVRMATASYREESDPLGRFLALCTVEEKGERVQSSKLYQLFIAWAGAAGEREWTQTGFSKAMTDRGHRKVESHGMRWLDLRMVKTPEDFAEDAMADDRGRSPASPFGGSDDDPL